MTNAKQELLDIVEKFIIKCADIHTEHSYTEADWEYVKLKVNYTEREYEEFIKKLDFKYDGGYGSQILYGIVWLTDGSWLERGEYDGSEWWERKICPNIPKALL